MTNDDKRVVKVGPRLSKFIGAKAPREKKMQAAQMQAEFTLVDTLIILCYLSRDDDREIAEQARKNLIPAARTWWTRPDKPELPDPIKEVVTKVIETVGLGDRAKAAGEETTVVKGNIGLFGLGEIIQAVDHNSRTAGITLYRDGKSINVYTRDGKVVGAVSDELDGLPALHTAFGWADALFTYTHAQPGPYQNEIKVNTLNLVMDALEYSPDDDPFDSSDSVSWKIIGHLKILNVFEIAEIFEMNSRQAMCRLRREDTEGILYFNNGRVINASLGDMTGMDAACHLLAWPSAYFLVTRGGEGVEEVIHAGMQNLIIEAMRQLDEGVTVSDQIADELAKIDQLFEGQDVVALPILDKVRLVFGEDQNIRETLEADTHPLVRKAIKVKISKTVHKYLNPTTDHDVRMNAARGVVPLSTTEKLVLLSYLSHDESEEIRTKAKETLANLDGTTIRKGFGSDLHPSVMDFLVRETIQDESLICVACATESILEETASFVLDKWQTRDVLKALSDNSKLLERSPGLTIRLLELSKEHEAILQRLVTFEESLLEGAGTLKAQGNLNMFGLAGMMRAASSGARSGTIVLEGMEGTGYVYISKGKMIGARWKDLSGMEALNGIVKAPNLNFRYVLRRFNHEENLDHAQAEDVLNSIAAGPIYDESVHTGTRMVGSHPAAMDVYEVLTALEHTPLPVRIQVVCEEGSGEIFRDKSRILHAHVEGKEDAYKAMAALLSWTPNRVIVRYATDKFPETVDKTLPDFFTESMKEIPDELKEVTNPGELPQWELSEEEFESLFLRILNMGVADKLKLAFTGNKEARDLLVRDSNKMVSVAVVKSPKIQEAEIEAIAKNRSIAEDVLRQIASTKEWMKSYSIKVNLCNNSKTPIPVAMNLVPQLREAELAKLAKSKNISQQVAVTARRLLAAKQEKR